jgi:hypothetical protein
MHTKVKVKVPLTGTKALRGGTSALEGVGSQHHAPAALPPGKTRYPLYRRLMHTKHDKNVNILVTTSFFISY